MSPSHHAQPPHVIDGRYANAHRVRDLLYGDPQPWVDRKQHGRWAWLLADFTKIGFFNVEKLIAEAHLFVALYGLEPGRGAPADEALRVRFKKYLWGRVKELGLTRVTSNACGRHTPDDLRRSLATRINIAIRADIRRKEKQFRNQVRGHMKRTLRLERERRKAVAT